MRKHVVVWLSVAFIRRFAILGKRVEGAIKLTETTILKFETHLFGIKGNTDGFLKIPKDHYELTNERLKINKQGIMTQSKGDIELFKIKDTTVKQKMKDKVMGVGDIEIISADESDPVIILKSIKDPHDVREKIRNAAKVAKEKVGVTYRHDI